jgi:hypothetical protein
LDVDIEGLGIELGSIQSDCLDVDGIEGWILLINRSNTFE